MSPRLFCLCTFVLFYLFCAAAEAQTYYAGGGSTTNCTTMQTSTTPSTTIMAALNCIGTTAGAGAGKTVIVKPGTYSENLDEASIGQWLPKGSVGNPFTLKAENRAVLRASDGTLSAGTSKAILRRNGYAMRVCAGGNFYTVIDGFDIDISIATSTDGGVSLACSASAPNFITMQYNDFHDSPRAMMLATGNHSDSANGGNSLYFYYNRFHDGVMDQSGIPGNPNYAYPVYVSAGYNGKFIGNEFYNFPAFGLHMNDQPSGAADQVQGQRIDNWEIAGNYFHDWSTYNGGSGGTGGANAAAIVFFNSGLTQSGAAGVGSITYNNIFKNGPDAIRLQGNAHLHKFLNNTLYHMTGNLASDSGSAVEIMADTIAKNNIFSGGTAQPYLGGYHGYDFSFNSTNMAFNFCTNAGAGCSATGDPAFNNTTNAAGFRLTAASTGAIDGGTNVASLIPCTSGSTCTDFIGTIRPQGSGWDMGAFEYGAPVTVSPQLVLALPLDEGSGFTATDVSGQKNNATRVGGAAWDNDGKYGKAIMFDGTGYLNIPYAPSLALSGMTLEAWVYPTSSADQFFTVIYQGNYWLFSSSSSGSCPTPATPTGGYVGASVNVICATSAPPINQWSHLAITYNGLAISFYLNGNLAATASLTDPMAPASNTVTIGRSANETEFFIGKIDEPRIYNYARSPTQIVSDMNTPLIGVPGKVVEIAAPVSVEISSASSIEISAD